MACPLRKCLQPNVDLGLLLLRLSLGGMMLLHGIAKLQHGVGMLEGMMQGFGLPAFTAYGVFLGELLAPVLFLIGWATRPAALLMSVTMLVAIFTAHLGDICSISPHGGWAIELPALYLFGALTLLCTGAGRFSLDEQCCSSCAKKD